jgi:ribosomal protein L31
MRTFLFSSSFILVVVACAPGGEVYRITSTDGKKTISYEVSFGDTSTHNVFTGFCLESQKFVSLSWLRGKEKAPEAAAMIWDHQTGRTIKLYRFPGCRDPLPVISSIEDLKVCPFTGDKKFKSKRIAFRD